MKTNVFIDQDIFLYILIEYISINTYIYTQICILAYIYTYLRFNAYKYVYILAKIFISFMLFCREERRQANVRGRTRPQAPRKQRALWDYFEKDFKTDKDGRVERATQRAKCNQCDATLKTPDSTPAPLKKHLKSHHPDEYAEWFAKHQAEEAVFLEKKKDQVKMEDATFKQPSVAAYLQKTPYGINSVKQERFDIELTKAIVLCNLPFSLCDNPYFKDLLTFLDPRINIKSRTTIGGRKVTILYHNVMEAVFKHLTKELPKVAGIGLTTDTWQSRSNDCYQSLTIHYIDEDFIIRR